MTALFSKNVMLYICFIPTVVQCWQAVSITVYEVKGSRGYVPCSRRQGWKRWSHTQAFYHLLLCAGSWWSYRISFGRTNVIKINDLMSCVWWGKTAPKSDDIHFYFSYFCTSVSLPFIWQRALSAELTVHSAWRNTESEMIKKPSCENVKGFSRSDWFWQLLVE